MKKINKAIEFYSEKYMNETEERGDEETKFESGSQTVNINNTVIDLTDLDMKIIESQHKLERLEFYEQNNILLWNQLEAKKNELETSSQTFQEDIKGLKLNHNKVLDELNKKFNTQLQNEKSLAKKEIERIKWADRKKSDLLRKELREEFQKMFSERLSEWKGRFNEYENKIRHLENIINSQ